MKLIIFRYTQNLIRKNYKRGKYIMNKISIGGFTRISKAAARKLYNENKAIYLCPVKLSPVNIWRSAAQVRKDCMIDYIDNSFENICNHFSFYNCNYNETGKYIAFYVKEK